MLLTFNSYQISAESELFALLRGNKKIAASGKEKLSLDPQLTKFIAPVSFRITFSSYDLNKRLSASKNGRFILIKISSAALKGHWSQKCNWGYFRRRPFSICCDRIGSDCVGPNDRTNSSILWEIELFS